MSDHEESGPNTGYDTPIPELDDHRQQVASPQRQERPRRGTFDSLYGSRQMGSEPTSPEIIVRDFEEAIIDEEGDSFRLVGAIAGGPLKPFPMDDPSLRQTQ
ncbi:hypothetical protein V2G26_020640 [Clonostachys chloroleuca]